MKVFKNSSLHHVHSDQTALFVTRTFSSILFHWITKESFSVLSSFLLASFSSLEESLTTTTITLCFLTLCFLCSTFQKKTPHSSNGNGAITDTGSFRGVGWLHHCVMTQLTWHSTFQSQSRSQFPSNLLIIEVRSSRSENNVSHYNTNVPHLY